MTRKSISALLMALILCASLLFTLISCTTPDTTTDDSTTTTEGNDVGDDPDTTSNGGTTDSTTSGGTNTTPTPSGKMNIKFFKVGKANATLIRTPSANILIDCGEEEDEDNNGKQDDGEKILEYLAEKGVTKLDLVIVSQFNKNHYGSIPTILEGVTVDKIMEPDYAKTGSTYEAYTAALTKAGITPEKVTKTTSLTVGEVALTIYPATNPTTSASADEFNSLAVAVEYAGCSALIASDIFSTRVNNLITALGGKTFDILQIPNHGAYSDTVEPLIDAVKPDYAVIFASDNNPEDKRVTTALTEKEITYFVTKTGAVEAKFEDGTLSVKQ